MFALFPDDLSETERKQAEELCQQYLFYHRTGRNSRLFYCTACGNVWEDRKGGRYYSGRGHNDGGQCPRCREGVILKAAGRLGRGLDDCSSLREYHTLVLLRRGEDDSLLVSAGLLEARYLPGAPEAVGWPVDDELDGLSFPERVLCYFERRRYYMAPGKLAAWKRHCGTRSNFYRMFDLPVSDWWNLQTAGEPVPRGSLCSPQVDNGAYYVLGWDCLPDTDMRYSAVELAFPPAWTEFRLYRGPVSYLAWYTGRPQLEMLTKLGFHHVLDELLREGSLHGLVNWRAKTPQKFFRLSKAGYRAWAQAGGWVSQLRLWQDLSKDMAMEQFMEYPVVQRAPGLIPQVTDIADRYRLSIPHLLAWLEDRHRAQMWIDYVGMGERLRLDFTRRDVLLPKDLTARHDTAAATLEIAENGKALRKYQARREHLVRTYAMEAAGYLIRVPETAAEIVAEGRALCHCVGGYAARHLEGKVVILFLRSAEDPDTPLCTIEMNGMRIVQIHGYKNDLESGAVPPEERFADFLSVWLPWVEAHSPRDAQGRPILPDQVRCEIA